MFVRFVIFILQFIWPLAFIWWKYWSKLYRFLFQRRYKDIYLEKKLSFVEVSERLSALTWRPDGWKELWDVCGSPEWVQFCLNMIRSGAEQPEGPLDCDDFAVWAINVINPHYSPMFFTIMWLTDEGKLVGHAMCWVRRPDGYKHHLGNWGVSSPYITLREACMDILLRVRAKKLVCWALLSKDLTLVDGGVKLPPKWCLW